MFRGWAMVFPQESPKNAALYVPSRGGGGHGGFLEILCLGFVGSGVGIGLHGSMWV